ncbi:f2o10.10 protein-like protein [Trypanosoma theileri]|uniref:F2o10.10 protein-like protein n=1 Tax=Trypanosoma theileri TaxID=67003 RepID=A0A1X0NLV0_9TRYP|nr:f2o10.10 protein-like protein [Trypanosoma theileri]ORC85531.1 f2o10.10 protein-like protein [Trypanosoma theileri]
MPLGGIIQLPRHERRKMYYWVGTFSCVLGFLLLIVLLLKNVLRDQKVVPSFIGGYCAIFATILSLFQILEHLTCFSDPECQTKVVRILFMVPLYAMISWICILAPNAAEYLNLIRDAYESYALYAFFQLMIALMGGVDTVYRALMLEERPPIPHFFPLCWLEPVKVTPTFVRNCRLCLFQFMVLKPLITVIVIILTAKNEMGSILDVRKGYFWTTLVCNTSITIAFTALVYFYTGLKEFMEGTDALMKFLCIKMVIFLSFWQGILIQLLSATHLLPNFQYWTEDRVPQGLQDLLICIEMMFVAFAHRYCFGSDAYEPTEPPEGDDAPVVIDAHAPHRSIPPIRYSVSANLKYTLRHEDIIYDFKEIMRNR